MEKCCDALEVGNVLVFPDAEVGDGDAAFGHDGRGFQNDQAGSALGTCA
jgi:hypothetical protein